MYKVYSLTNPLSGEVFYVGATKNELKSRLSGHCSIPKYKFSTDGAFNSRTELMKQLKQAGVRPIITLLIEVSLEYIDDAERYFYTFFKGRGHDMLQGSWHFSYSSQKKKSSLN